MRKMKNLNSKILILLILLSPMGLVWANSALALETTIINQTSLTYNYNGLPYSTGYSTTTTIVPAYYGINILPNGSIENPGQVRHGNAGFQVYFSYTLFNTGNVKDSYTLDVVSVEGDFYPGAMHIYLDTNENGIFDVGEPKIEQINNLAPDEYVMLVAAMTIPSSAKEFEVCYINLRGRSVGDNTKFDDNNVSMAEVTGAGNLTINKVCEPTKATVGDTIFYQISFGNNGSGSISDVVITDYINWNGNALNTTYILGSLNTNNNNGILSYYIVDGEDEYWTEIEPDNGTLVRGVRCQIEALQIMEQGILTFEVMINPGTEPGLIDNFVFYDYNNYKKLKSNIVHTKVEASSEIYLGPYENPEALPGGELSEDDLTTIEEAVTGEQILFRNTVKNSGNSPDIINISVIRELSTIPANWIVRLYQADGTTPLIDNNGDNKLDVGLVPVGGSRSFAVKLFVPKSAYGDNSGKFWDIMLKAESSVQPNASPNFTIDRVELIRDTKEYWAPITQIVEPSGVVWIDQRLRYTITFANISSDTIEHAVLTDPLDDRLIKIGDVTTGHIYMYPQGTFGDGAKGDSKIAQQDSVKVYLTGTYHEDEHKIVWKMENLPPRYGGSVVFYANIHPSTPDETIIPNQAFLVSNRTPEVIASNIVEVSVLRPMLSIAKEAIRKTLEVGDVTEYKITVNNISPNAHLVNATVTDEMPLSFRYLEGTSRIDSLKVSDPEMNGNILTWSIPDTFFAGTSHIITFNAVVGVNAKIGTHTNEAYADGYSSRLNIYRDSPVASADVRVIEGLFREEGTILGKVFIDENDNRIQNDGEPGLHNIRIYMENGTFAVTDKNGLYSIVGVEPGVHILKIDPITIPPDLYPKYIDNRFVGDPGSQFVELLPSGNAKANFRLIRPPEPLEIFARKNYLAQEVRLFPMELPKPIKILNIPSSHFATGKADLRTIPEEFDKLAKFIEEHPEWQVLVEGHTDPRPIHTEEFPSNWELSEARAWAVANALIERGVPKDKFIVKGYAATIPKVPNTSLENMAINRRVEVTLIPPSREQSLKTRMQFIYRINYGDSLMKDVELIASKPKLAIYIEGSARWNEKSLENPNIKDSTIIWNLGEFQNRAKGTLSYAVQVKNDDLPDIVYSQAHLRWKDSQGNEYISDKFEIDLNPEYRPATQEIIFTLGDFLYDTGKADLRPLSVYYLDRLVEMLTVNYPNATALIEGHTDIRPIHTKEFPSNQELSEARAKSVYDYFVAHGVDPDRLTMRGYGPNRPVAPNTTPENLQKNRRTEVTIQLETPKLAVKTVEKGGQVEILVETSEPLDSLSVSDQIPMNMIYVKNSSKLNGGAVPNPELDNNKITWTLKEIPQGTSRLSYEVFPAIENDSLELDSLSKPNISIGKAYKVRSPGKSNPKSAPQMKQVESEKKEEKKQEIPEKKEIGKEEAGILSPQDGEVFTQRSKISVEIQVPFGAHPELIIDGNVVSEDQIGKKIFDPEKGISRFEYVSVQIHEGANQITAFGKLGDGKRVESQPITVHFAGKVAKMKLKTDPDYIPADGITKPKVILQVRDENDLPVIDGVFVTVKINKGMILTGDAHPAMPGHQIRTKNGNAEFVITPSSKTETRIVKASVSDFEFEDELEFEPELREFMMIALVEGTVGYQPFGGAMDKVSLKDQNDFEDEVWVDGGVKMFLKGKILGKYLLTAHYDSKKIPNKDKLFKKINPENYYPVYGDESKTHHDAESQSPLFVKLERKKSYALYGDYRTNLNQNEFSRYNRSLNGAKMNLENDYYRITTYAAYTNQSIQIEELRGEGVSGYYFLGHTPIIENSEKISIETRERFHEENVLTERKLVRHKEYEIDYEDGSIMFREPIHSQDEELNPVYIIIKYESRDKDDKYYQYGGHAEVKYEKHVKVGATYVVEEDGVKDHEMYGVDGTVNLWKKSLTLKGEYAYTESHDRPSANAYLLRLDANTKWAKFDLYYHNMEKDFHNPSMGASEVGKEKYGVRWNLKNILLKRLTFSGEAYRQLEEEKDTELDVLKGLIGYSQGILKTKVGYQYNRSKDAEEKSSQMGIAEISLKLFKNLQIALGHEQILDGEIVNGFPSKTKGKLEYRHSFGKDKILSGIRVYNNLEYLYGDEDSDGEDNKNELVSSFGIEGTFFKNTKIYTQASMQERSKQIKEGIQQNLKLWEHWNFTFKGESAQNIDTESKAEEYEAFSGQMRYNDKSKDGRQNDVTTRYEIRLADNSTKHVFNFQTKQRFSDNSWLFAKETYWYDNIKNGDGKDRTKSDGYIGFASRPILNDKLNFVGVVRYKYNKGADIKDSRLIFSWEGIYQFNARNQLKGRYAAKKSNWLSNVTDSETSAFTDLMLAEYIFDINDRLDIGTGARILHQYESNTYRYSLGAQLGLKLFQNVYAVGGYNIIGFEDRDFSNFNYWKRGPFLSLRLKLDEDIFK